MRDVALTLRAISLLALGALPLLSTLQGIMSLSYPLGEADEVLVATVTGSVEDVSSGSVDLLVQRSLRGSVRPGSTIVASYPIVSSGMVGPPRQRIDIFRGTTGIWFLKQSDPGWTLVSRTSNPTSLLDIYIPVPAEMPPVRYAHDAGMDVRKKLLLEIEAAATNPLTARSIANLWGRLIMDDFGKDLLTPMYARLASSSEGSARFMGVAGQLRLGNPSALTALAAMTPDKLPENWQAQLAVSLCHFRNADPAGVAGLAALLESVSNARMKTCAVYALREIHTRESLPILAKLLHSDSTDVRYNAMIGIAQYAMSFPMARVNEKPGMMATYTGENSTLHREMTEHYPSTSLFASNQEHYLSYWKAYLAHLGVH